MQSKKEISIGDVRSAAGRDGGGGMEGGMNDGGRKGRRRGVGEDGEGGKKGKERTAEKK